jgi:hypothetical protein
MPFGGYATSHWNQTSWPSLGLKNLAERRDRDSVHPDFCNHRTDRKTGAETDYTATASSLLHYSHFCQLWVFIPVARPIKGRPF